MRRAALALALLVVAAPAAAAPRDSAVLSTRAQAFGWRPAPKVTPLPNRPAPATPPPVVPPGPAPSEAPRAEPTPTTPRPKPPREPWYLTVHARDVGNGDFRLLPAIGDIPAGTLYLSYLNEDETAHDLWLGDTELFAPYVGDELQRTKLELTPGTYQLLCRMPGHEQMRRGFRVTP